MYLYLVVTKLFNKHYTAEGHGCALHYNLLLTFAKLNT